MTKAKLIKRVVLTSANSALLGGIWLFRSVDHQVTGTAERSFVADCDFSKFRQIMVRKNATEAIVSAGGMKLLSQSLDDVSIDTSKDDRPILNAIRGRSKAELVAVKQMTVQINDANVDAEELKLKQVADIEENRMSVETHSIAAAAQLQSYRTTLNAESSSEGTEVKLTLEMVLQLTVPALLRKHADGEVQKSAGEALAAQEEAIRDFIERHKDKRFIFPD